MTTTHIVRAATLALVAIMAGPHELRAQGFSSAASKPKPWSRVSVFATNAKTNVDGGLNSTFTEMNTAFAYQLPDTDDDGLDYGVDLRFAESPSRSRPQRLSIYEGFVGARMSEGAVKFRLGHMWLNDLGSLGSIAGGVFELRQRRLLLEDPRFRAGVFAGMEPNILDTGYASNIKKLGGYVAYDGEEARRHSLGYVMVRNGSLTERSVLSTTNFIPAGRKFFLYQSLEYDVQAPAGQGRRGLAYLFVNGRVNPTDRLEIQSVYNRGRSIDARSIAADLVDGRVITQKAVDGLLYESIGGRVTVEAFPRLHVYGGYSRDKNNRDAEATGRTLIGGYASNVAGSGIDISVSDSLMNRPTGNYHSRYFSVGHQVGRNAYLSGDYTTSLSVVRFSRSDGITIESRPHTTRYSGTGTLNITRTVSILATVELTNEDQMHEFRVLSGLTYRIK